VIAEDTNCNCSILVPTTKRESLLSTVHTPTQTAPFVPKMLARTLKSACAVCFGAGFAAFGMSGSLDRSVAHAEQSQEEEQHKVLIIGGGTAGTTVANQIVRKVFLKLLSPK
jgi:malic enzyme